MFWIKNKKNRYAPVNTFFHFIKVGIRGYTCFPDYMPLNTDLNLLSHEAQVEPMTPRLQSKYLKLYCMVCFGVPVSNRVRYKLDCSRLNLKCTTTGDSLQSEIFDLGIEGFYYSISSAKHMALKCPGTICLKGHI